MFERLKGSDDAIVIAEVGQNHQEVLIPPWSTSGAYPQQVQILSNFKCGITSHSLRQRRTTKLMKVKMLLDLLMENIVKNLN